MPDLDEQIRDYYAQQSLPDTTVARLLAAPTPRRSRTRRVSAIAAAVLLLLSIGSMAVIQNRETLEKAVAKEVWKNHRKALPPDIFDSGFDRIQAGLDRLTFAIIPTRPDLLAGYTVEGGRYCSIRQELAAQIHLRDSSGLPCTLYIAPLTADLQKVDPGVIRLEDGAQVEIWRDGHRLFALARQYDAIK